MSEPATADLVERARELERAGGDRETARDPGTPTTASALDRAGTTASPLLARHIGPPPSSQRALEQFVAGPVNQLPNPLDQLPPGLRAHVSAADAEKMSRYLAGFLSSGDDYDRPTPRSDAHPGPRTVAIPAAPLLRGDILGGGADGSSFVAQHPRERAFRSALYARVLDSGFVIHLGAQRRGRVPVLEVALTWGPYDWKVEPGPDGLIGWRELMAGGDLEYVRLTLAEQLSVIEATQALRERARGPLEVRGRKLGEIVRQGRPWEPDVRLGAEIGGDAGGLGFRDQVTATMHMYGSSSGRALLRTPLGDYHVYELSSPLDVMTDFGRPTDGIARISAAEGDLGPRADVVLIVGRGGVEFRPATGGWTAPIPKDAVTLGDSLLYGAILGDFWDDPDAEAVVAQIVVGLIPGVGQAADARDIAAGIDKLWESSGKDGKLQTLFAVIGLVPGVGDAIKAAYKGGRRAVVAAVREAAPMARRALVALIKESPYAVADRFRLAERAAAAAGDIETVVTAALRPGAKPGGAEVQAAIAAIRRTLDAAGGNAGAVVRRASRSGRWKELAQVIAKGGDEAADLGRRLNLWRTEEIEALHRHLPSLQADAARYAGRPVSPPHFQQTGTVKDMGNDVDISSLGPDAGRYAHLAKGYLERRYGMPYERVKEMLDLEILTDPTRLLLAFEHGSPAAKRAAERLLTQEAEINTMVKMLQGGVDPARVSRYAAQLIDAETLARYRAASVAELLAARRKEVATFTDAASRTQREFELDALHRRYATATDPVTRAAMAREIAILQGRLNVGIKDAYATAGSVAINVVVKDPVAGARAWLALTPALRYQAVLGDLAMLETTLVTYAKVGITKDTVKPLSKYADRLLTRAGQVGGVDMAKAGLAREIFDDLDGLLKGARRDAAGAAADERYATRFYDATMFLREEVEAIVRASKSKAASGPAPAVGEELAVLERQLASLTELVESARLAQAALVGLRQTTKGPAEDERRRTP